MKKNFLLAAVTLGAASLANTLLSAPVKAAFVDVPIQVEVPEIIYIQTYQSLTFKPNSSEFFGVPQNTVGNFTSDGSVDTPLPDPGTLTATSGTIQTGDVLVYKIWGTSTGTNNQIEHSVAYNGSGILYLNGDTSSSNQITISVISPTSAQSAAAPGLDTSEDPILGNVQFGFNFANALASGTYSPPAGEALRITATGI
ncbi:hypothetical protein H6G80_06365 [Nostoc sp. FACHB-87]|uniref:hypothetical protein n=1 Tax=Nostocales TaxID=1161 RepID=UPI001689775F|nr:MULTISPECIES: hypothetical protein [Nostocales]MBD2300461.1 hypothetical protein [Nostoc sp. FACHB-190]MBD2453698.1 hypothetical protein [Nostoc sp. FACHB-87]MBD2475347.1 hypothetical protein [Anabaena sp. FACHB-83]MBD2488869.1 hypothetical protein [Aulosira sp. FACHB-615]